jgi:hypothetical protein
MKLTLTSETKLHRDRMDCKHLDALCLHRNAQNILVVGPGMIYSNKYLPFPPNRVHGDLRFTLLLLRILGGTRIASSTFNPHPFADLYQLL